MRIAVWHNLPSGGGMRAMVGQLHGLVARGHHVEVWCPPTADRSFLPLGPAIPEHVVPLDWPTPWRRLDEWQVTLEIDRSIAAMDAHCRACATAIDAGGFDVVLAHPCMWFRTTAIGRLVRTPALLYLQEPMRRLYEAQPGLPWLARPRDAWSPWRPSTWRKTFVDVRTLRNNRVQAREEVANAAAFARILVNSYFSRESLLRAYGLDSEVCYLGIDSTHFTDRGDTREHLVIGLGSLLPEKGAHRAIEAVGTMAMPRPRLAWVGNFADRAYLAGLTALAEARGVDFEPLVRIADEKLLDLLNRAAAMIYAPRLEPFGLAPLEAAACGVPVVAVAEGGVRETVIHGETGLLVPSDPAAIGAAVERLLHDTATARRLGTQARDNVRTRWNQDAATERVERVLLRHASQAPSTSATTSR